MVSDKVVFYSQMCLQFTDVLIKRLKETDVHACYHMVHYFSGALTHNFMISLDVLIYIRYGGRESIGTTHYEILTLILDISSN